MKRNAKMKVLYQDGNPNLREPFTFDVVLVRWKKGVDWLHYVLTSSYTIEEMDGAFAILQWREMITSSCLVDAETDGEAIRQAVDEYERLKAHTERLSQEDGKCAEMITNDKKHSQWVHAQNLRDDYFDPGNQTHSV